MDRAQKLLIQTFKPPQGWQNRSPGIGDFIRGLCFLHERFEGTHVSVRVDIGQTEFGSCIVDDPALFVRGDLQQVNNAEELLFHKELSIARLDQFAQSDERQLFITTDLGLWNRQTLSESTRNFVKPFFRFHDWIEDDVRKAVPVPDYEVLSIRAGDFFWNDPKTQMLDQPKHEIFSMIEKSILPRSKYPLAVTTECFPLRIELMERYGFLGMMHHSQHGAMGNGHLVAKDLCLLKNSRCNYHINAWASWWSGFSHYTSLIHKIPSLNFRWPKYELETVTANGEFFTSRE